MTCGLVVASRLCAAGIVPVSPLAGDGQWDGDDLAALFRTVGAVAAFEAEVVDVDAECFRDPRSGIAKSEISAGRAIPTDHVCRPRCAGVQVTAAAS